MRRAVWGVVLVVAWGAGGAACGGGGAQGPGRPGAAEHGPHRAPPGTVGVAIGDHLAQLSVAVDSATGTLTIRVYDGHFENPVRVAQTELVVRVLQPPGEYVEVRCAAQADSLSGETVGNTSTFRGQADELKTMQEFEAVLTQFDVRGQKISDFKFPYPAGIKLH